MRHEPSRIEAHAQVIAHQFLVVELQLVAQEAVDPVDGEMLAPVVAPFRPVVALDGEDQLADGLRQLAQPVVVLVGVVGRRREQLDHRAQRALRAQDRPLGASSGARLSVDREKSFFRISATWSMSRVIVLHEDRPLQQHVGDGFRDLRLAAARNRAGLVAQRAVRPRAHQPPGRAAELLFQPHPVARGQHVDVAGAQRQLLRRRRPAAT